MLGLSQAVWRHELILLHLLGYHHFDPEYSMLAVFLIFKKTMFMLITNLF
jgi:hypothetical protein